MRRRREELYALPVTHLHLGRFLRGQRFDCVAQDPALTPVSSQPSLLSLCTQRGETGGFKEYAEHPQNPLVLGTGLTVNLRARRILPGVWPCVFFSPPPPAAQGAVRPLRLSERISSSSRRCRALRQKQDSRLDSSRRDESHDN